MSVLTLFQTSQCSWCRKFYTNEGFLCPFGRLQSNCAAFDELSKAEAWFWREARQELLGPRISEMMGQVTNKGTLSKCRYLECGVLNPNPQKDACWKCGRTLSCPRHPGLILRYSIEADIWRCPDTAHGQVFGVIERPDPAPSQKRGKPRGAGCAAVVVVALLMLGAAGLLGILIAAGLL